MHPDTFTDVTVGPATPASAQTDAFKQKARLAIAGVWERSRDTVMARLGVLEQASVAFKHGIFDPGDRLHTVREAHKLVGALGTFGFAEGSRLAREIEHILESNERLPHEQISPFTRLVVDLRQEIERGPVSFGMAPSLTAETDYLLIVDSDDQLTELLALEAAARGMHTEIVTTVAAARAAVARACPDVVLLDLSVSDTEDDGLLLLAELSAQETNLPVLIHSANDTFIDRVTVSRLGGSGFLQKPMLPAQVLDVVRQVLTPQQGVSTRVLAVDDDSLVLDVLGTLLHRTGIEITTLNDPLRFWDVLDDVSPDLLLLDVDMPGLDGIELCQVVRNSSRWSKLPVLFITARNDTASVQRIFAAGADDYVAKPIAGPELLARITSRIERNQLHRSLEGTDASTGLVDRHTASQVLGYYLKLATRQKEPLSLALFQVDDFADINVRHGRPTGDAMLRRLGDLLTRMFRTEDVVARWVGDQLLLGLYTMRKDRGAERVQVLLDALRRETFRTPGGSLLQVSASVGMAEYPADGPVLSALCAAATRVLIRAKAAGPGRVMVAGWRPPKTDATTCIDIVIVDNDEAQAVLLAKALATRGYATQSVRNGSAAIAMLGGESPNVYARLVLLDVGALDDGGLSVLTYLARDEILKETRVIVMAPAAADAAVRTARALGACDDIGKPLTMSDVTQRVRRALTATP
jgi:diguanylate cyclase (GGDEF)-like protein